MKHNIFTTTLLLCLVANYVSFSQDEVILSSGDTISCKINKVSKKHLHFSQNVNGVSSKGKIPKEMISEWSYKMNSSSLAQELDNETNKEVFNKPEQESEKVDKHPDYGKIRASVMAGLGYLTGNTKDAVDNMQSMGVDKQLAEDYYKAIKLGSQVKSSLYYHLFKDYWLGALYHGFYTSAEITTSLPLDDVNMYYGKLGEQFFVNFAGISFCSASRFGKTKKIGLNSSFSIGPAFYRNETETLNEQILIQGTTLGSNLNLGFEYFVKPQLSISIETGLFVSNLKKLTVKTVEGSRDIELNEEDYENLSRIDLSFGLVYYW
jgi:hypothetical protein